MNEQPQARDRASRVMVTGALGFIGSHVALQAATERREVLGLCRPESEAWTPRRSQLVDANVPVHESHLETFSDLVAQIEAFRPEVVIHAAGSTRRDPSAWEHLIRENVLTTASVVAAMCAISEARRPVLVLPGSQAEYGALQMPWTEDRCGQPNSPYGASKLAATEIVLAAQRTGSFRASVVRLPIVFGGTQGPTMLVPQLITAALAGQDFDMTAGEQKRRFLYVKDAASVLLEVGDLALSGSHPPLLNAPAGDPLSLRSVAQRVLGLMGDPIQLNMGALPYQPHEQLEAWPATSLADSLDFEPLTDLDLALRDTIESYSRAGPTRVTEDGPRGNA